jgi:transcriptional regulator with XRE-family HTH domain
VPPLPGPEPFGKRLARLRKAAGYSQYTLADAVGTSQRMIAHYEIHNGNPPLYLLPRLGETLGVTVDQLLGLEKVKENRAKDNRLRRRIAEVEKLPAPQRREVAQYLDTFLKAHKG